MADKKAAEKKEPLTDSEGLKVASVQDETVEEEKSLNEGAKAAFEAEVAAYDAEDARKKEEFDKFLAERG